MPIEDLWGQTLPSKVGEHLASAQARLKIYDALAPLLAASSLPAILKDLHINVDSQQQAKGDFPKYLSKHKLTVPPGFVAKFVFEPGMKYWRIVLIAGSAHGRAITFLYDSHRGFCPNQAAVQAGQSASGGTWSGDTID